MILNFVLGAILGIGTFIIAQAPQVTQLPFGMTEFVKLTATYTYAFASVFWPFTPILTCFTVYIGLKLIMIPLRFALGARAPQVYDI